MQERLLDASGYLEQNTKKYKSARAFYWNQVKRMTPTVARDPRQPKAPTIPVTEYKPFTPPDEGPPADPKIAAENARKIKEMLAGVGKPVK